MRKAYRYNIATQQITNPTKKLVSSWRLRLRPRYSLTDATKPAKSRVHSSVQNTAGSPAMLSITKNATAAPIAVRWVLERINRDIMSDAIVHRKAVDAILRKRMSDGERIIVMA